MTPWYLRYVRPLAETYRVPVDLVVAIIEQESAGRAFAYRFEPTFYDRYLADNLAYAGREPARVSASYGLMQIMYPTAVDAGFQGEPELLFVPAINLDVGCSLLAALIRWAKGDVPQALAAYNGGRGGWQGDAATRYAVAVLDRLVSRNGIHAD